MSKNEQNSSRKTLSSESPVAAGMRAYPTGLEVQAAIQRGRRMQAHAIVSLFSRLGK